LNIFEIIKQAVEKQKPRVKSIAPKGRAFSRGSQGGHGRSGVKLAHKYGSLLRRGYGHHCLPAREGRKLVARAIPTITG
jgi:hypothetical protein